LTHLKHFTLTIRSTRLDDEAKLPPDLVYTSTLLKPLATIAHLTKLHLDGPHIITPDFFSSLPPTAFPALKYFHLDFAPESANGQWFFERDEAWIANLSNEDIDSGSESSSSESSSSESSSSESSSSESSSSESSSSESDDDEENDNGFGDTEG
jgi:hypothetical protein